MVLAFFHKLFTLFNGIHYFFKNHFDGFFISKLKGFFKPDT